MKVDVRRAHWTLLAHGHKLVNDPSKETFQGECTVWNAPDCAAEPFVPVHKDMTKVVMQDQNKLIGGLL